ncbi:hypothetical protein POM88_004017 [Heracleum sosnowskyi]|uniref:Uncharacterized protein n=1 Tax=Heracleum sosnowskyi TaxID=360622 RepID=A0AAD8JKW4_9APIA|nr:hypothetical protein POM88_004017 [Heracleum sosnowskyi]
MANYAKALSVLLVIAFFTTLKVEARDSKYFSKFNQQVEQPSFKPSSETKNYNDFQFENPETDFPPEEFIENIKKDSSETNAFSRDSDEPSYMTGPQTYKERDGNDAFYPNEGVRNTDASANDGFELSDEEKKFFNEKEGTNSYKTYNNDRENVHATEAQGLSDTRTLENGKYFYNPRAVKPNSGSERSNEYFGKKEYKSKYGEFRPLKDFEYNPQNQDGFLP